MISQLLTPKKPQSCLLELTLLEKEHTHSYMLPVVFLVPGYPLTNFFFSEIFVGVMLCDRQVCPHVGELKFCFQWVRLIVHLTKAGFILLLGQGRGERGMLEGWRWEKQGAECQLGCSIQLHVKWFVILSNHLGQALAPFYLYMTLGQSQYS